jgi:Flp pilus assembly protein TadB
MNPLWMAVIVAGLVSGLVVLVAGLIPDTEPSRPPSTFLVGARRLVGAGLPSPGLHLRHVVIVLAAAGLTGGWWYTGIPAVGLVAAAGIGGIPWLFGAARAETATMNRLRGVEAWTRRLSDLVRTGAGLHQAIIVSAIEPPAAIADDLAALAADLHADQPTAAALQAFADRLNDASSDEVIAALLLSTHQRGPRLAEVLDRISEGMAELITMRLEVASSRTDARIATQLLSAITLIGLGVLVINRTYMASYHTIVGQLVLIGCVIAFAGVLAWARHLNMPYTPNRLLARDRSQR